MPKVQRYLPKNEISQGVVGTYTENDIPIVVTSLLSDGLFIIDKSGIPKPHLVQDWQVNKEATSYIFKLKDNLKWIDGTSIKSTDLNISIPDATLETPDDQTIQVKLVDSFSPLPTILLKPIFKKNTLIGTGPFIIKKIEKSQIFVKKITLVSQDEKLPNVVVRFYPNEKIAKNALALGEVQSLVGVTEIEDLEGPPFGIYSKTNYTQLVAIFYNTKDTILSDKNIRLALSYAAPAISGQTKAKTSIPPISWAFYNGAREYLDNPEQAKSYLSKVKMKDATITLTVTTPLKSVGEMIVASWSKQGINAVVREESGIPQNFQALLIPHNIPIDPDQYLMWHSTQTKTNITQYNSQNQYSPRVDKDLEDGRKTTDLEVRKTRYHDFQKSLMDDAPATFLYFPKFNVVFLRKIEPDLIKILSMQLMDLHLDF